MSRQTSPKMSEDTPSEIGAATTSTRARRTGSAPGHTGRSGASPDAPLATIRAGAWTSAQAEAWRHWLMTMLLDAHLAAYRRPLPTDPPTTRHIRVFYKDIEGWSGIYRSKMHSYLAGDVQPSPGACLQLARLFEVHPLAVMYRAGLIENRDLAELLGAGLPTPSEAHAVLDGLETLRDQTGRLPDWAEPLARHARQLYQQVSELQQHLGLSDDEFGGIKAEFVRREIHAENAPVQVPPPPKDGPEALPSTSALYMPGPRPRPTATTRAATDDVTNEEDAAFEIEAE